jgi:hypothetical protein
MHITALQWSQEASEDLNGMGSLCQEDIHEHIIDNHIITFQAVNVSMNPHDFNSLLPKNWYITRTIIMNKKFYTYVFSFLLSIWFFIFFSVPLDYSNSTNVIPVRLLQFIVMLLINIIVSASIDSIVFWMLVKSCPEYWALVFQASIIIGLAFEAQAIKFSNNDPLHWLALFLHIMYGIQFAISAIFCFANDSMPFAGRKNRLFTSFSALLILLYLRFFLFTTDMYAGIICIPGYLGCIQRSTYIIGLMTTMIFMTLKIFVYQLMYPASLVIISARVESVVPKKARSVRTFIIENTKDVADNIGALVLSNSASSSNLLRSTSKVHIDTHSQVHSTDNSMSTEIDHV